jgi:hypothetical protein
LFRNWHCRATANSTDELALALVMATALPLALILALAVALTWHRALPFDQMMSFFKFSLQEYFKFFF